MALKSIERRVDELEIEVDSISVGGISDGDKGDISVSSSGSVWTIDNSAVTDAKIASGITASKITQDSTHRFATDTEKSTWNGKADLVGGVVPTSQIPAIAITEFLGSVASQSAMLALVGQVGDWCIRTDEQYGYVIIGSDPTLLVNWQKIVTPSSPVTSVNSQVGAVVLGASDVGAPSGSGSSTGTNTGDETNATILTKLGFTPVPETRTLTINGSTQDLSANRTFTISDPSGYTTIIKSADQDVTNSATFVPDTELQFSVVANGFYMIEMHLAYSGNDVAGDYKYSFNVSAGTMSGTGSATSLATSGGTVLNGVTVNGTATTSTVPCGVGTNNFNYIHSSFCTFSFYASANGTFRMQFANNSAGAGRTSRTNKGSILKYKKIN